MQTIQRILIAYEVIEKMRPDGTDRDDASERIARDGAEIARAAGFDTTAEVISSTVDPADARSPWTAFAVARIGLPRRAPQGSPPNAGDRLAKLRSEIDERLAAAC